MTLTDTVKGAASLTARFALYPSILYNLARNRLQDNWHWWDKITEVGPSAQEQFVQQPPGPVRFNDCLQSRHEQRTHALLILRTSDASMHLWGRRAVHVSQ